MDQIKDGWFYENNVLWPGQRFSLEVKKVLTHEKSDIQDVVVLDTKNHGRALILDGIIQCTEHDEFAYQEMITFIPLCAHPRPKSVLIVGGGDGGVAREVQKHPLVESIVQVEIDQTVIDVSKKYLSFMAEGFTSEKLKLHVADGFEYLRNHKNEFDVIITDSSDPVGPAVNLYTESYFRLLKEALRDGGIMCSQGGTVWVDPLHVKSTLENCKRNFSSAKYAFASVPTYPTGQIGFIIGCLDAEIDVATPSLKIDEKYAEDLKLRYYREDIHKAAFVLPNFANKLLYS